MIGRMNNNGLAVVFSVDAHLESVDVLFELFPHLASTFYCSLALNLSRRLREQIMLKQSGGPDSKHQV